MTVVQITSAKQFQELANGDKPLVTDFTASWCPPCKVISPVFHELAENNDDLVFASLDVDEVADVAAAQGVRAMPTFQVLKKGQKVDEMVGAAPAKLAALIKKHSQ